VAVAVAVALVGGDEEEVDDEIGDRVLDGDRVMVVLLLPLRTRTPCVPSLELRAVMSGLGSVDDNSGPGEVGFVSGFVISY
jgi:hypothetical protein